MVEAAYEFSGNTWGNARGIVGYNEGLDAFSLTCNQGNLKG